MQMISFLLAGLLIAIGHHLFYQQLDGRPVGSSSWIVAGRMLSSQQRTAFFATGAIFLSKMFFGMCIAKAFDQQLWFTAHRKLIKVGTLEALFSVLNAPSAFFNLEMLSKAKTATFLALILWCLPIAMVPVPGAISVKRSSSGSDNKIIVPTVNLNPEANNQGDSLASYSPISTSIMLIVDFKDLSIYLSLGVYVKPSPFMSAFAARTLAAGEIATWPSPCGPDCSYNQSFFGPSFSCSPAQSNRTGSAQLRWDAKSRPGNTSDTLSIQ